MFLLSEFVENFKNNIINNNEKRGALNEISQINLENIGFFYSVGGIIPEAKLSAWRVNQYLDEYDITLKFKTKYNITSITNYSLKIYKITENENFESDSQSSNNKLVKTVTNYSIETDSKTIKTDIVDFHSIVELGYIYKFEVNCDQLSSKSTYLISPKFVIERLKISNSYNNISVGDELKVKMLPSEEYITTFSSYLKKLTEIDYNLENINYNWLVRQQQSDSKWNVNYIKSADTNIYQIQSSDYNKYIDCRVEFQFSNSNDEIDFISFYDNNLWQHKVINSSVIPTPLIETKLPLIIINKNNSSYLGSFELLYIKDQLQIELVNIPELELSNNNIYYYIEKYESSISGLQTKIQYVNNLNLVNNQKPVTKEDTTNDITYFKVNNTKKINLEINENYQYNSNNTNNFNIVLAEITDESDGNMLVNDLYYRNIGPIESKLKSYKIYIERNNILLTNENMQLYVGDTLNLKFEVNPLVSVEIYWYAIKDGTTYIIGRNSQLGPLPSFLTNYIIDVGVIVSDGDKSIYYIDNAALITRDIVVENNNTKQVSTYNARANISSVSINDNSITYYDTNRIIDGDKINIVLDKNAEKIEWGRREVIYNSSGMFESNGVLNLNTNISSYTLTDRDIGYYIDARIYIKDQGYYYLSNEYDNFYFNYCLPNINLQINREKYKGKVKINNVINCKFSDDIVLQTRDVLTINFRNQYNKKINWLNQEWLTQELKVQIIYGMNI